MLSKEEVGVRWPNRYQNCWPGICGLLEPPIIHPCHLGHETGPRSVNQPGLSLTDGNAIDTPSHLTEPGASSGKGVVPLGSFKSSSGYWTIGEDSEFQYHFFIISSELRQENAQCMASVLYEVLMSHTIRMDCNITKEST